MSRKESGPSKAAMKNLAYVAPKQPAFLTAFKAQLQNGGVAPAASSEFDFGGRAALPTRGGGRQTSEEREEEQKEREARDRERERDEDEWGFGEGDEAPQVVVVKEGRHMTQEQLTDDRRAAKGLAPIEKRQAKALPPPASSASAPSSSKANAKAAASPATGSSSVATGSKSTKRKAVAVGGDAKEVAPSTGDGTSKKKKKEKKGLLSFDEEG